jgi:ASC-1-like (ASCH) protein
MEINDNEAELTWSDIKNAIYKCFECGLSCKICPFCRIYNICEGCEYAKHHKYCQNSESEFRKICNIIHEKSGMHINKILTNEKYREIIEYIEEKYAKIFTEEKENTKTKLKIKGKRIKENIVDIIETDNLYKKYDFTRETCEEILIPGADILAIRNQDFENLNLKMIETVLDIAESCEINNDTYYNFVVHSNGKIEIGNNMKSIKNKINKLRKAYEKWRDNRYNIIEISIE